MIPDDIVEQVREHADIVAIVGEHVKLKRVGTSYRGPCPFHQGKDPNFSVSPKGGYMCFVCHEKGDVFTFVQKRLGMDFVDAVKYVGGKSGVEVKEITRERDAGPDPRTRFWEMNAAAAEFFARTLWVGEAGAPARAYLEQRAIDRATAERFGIGFAPRDRDALRSHLQSLGYDDAAQIQAGLLVVREDRGETEPRPRFRNRLMFTIYDVGNRVIAFGGRVIGEGEPKYLNSAESPTYQKGSTLYGLNWAKNSIRKDERVLLVEGFFDAVRLLAAGVESTVAPLGTALTDAQAELILRYTSNVFLLYDSDKAGLKATFRAGDVLLRHGGKVLVVTLPNGEDPDTFVRSQGRETLEAQLGHAVDVLERKIQILQRGGWFSDLRRKRVALDRLLPTVAAASDPITRGLYVARTAEAVGVSEDVLQRELSQGARRERAGAPRATETAAREDVAAAPKVRKGERRKEFGTEWLSAERELIRLLLHRRQFVEEVAERVGLDSFRDSSFATIFRCLVESPDEAIDNMSAAFDEDTVTMLNELTANPGGLDVPARIIEDCIARLKQREIAEEIDLIDRKRPLADEQEKDRLNMRKRDLMKRMQELSGGRR